MNKYRDRKINWHGRTQWSMKRGREVFSNLTTWDAQHTGKLSFLNNNECSLDGHCMWHRVMKIRQSKPSRTTNEISGWTISRWFHPLKSPLKKDQALVNMNYIKVHKICIIKKKYYYTLYFSFYSPDCVYSYWQELRKLAKLLSDVIWQVLSVVRSCLFTCVW